MEPTEPVSQRLHYQKRSHTSSDRDEDEQWFMVDVKIYGRTLAINVCPEEFENSPTILDEFNQYLEILQLDLEGEWFSDEGQDDDVFEGGEAANPRPALDLSLHGCYEWAVKPIFPLLEEIASRPSVSEPITLQHFFSGESFEASLTAVDDSLIPGVVEAKDDMEDVFGDPGVLWKTTCPIFQAREVEVLSDDPIYTLVNEPTRVRVQGRQLFFKAFQELNDSMGAKEVLTLEEVFKARFDPKEVRTSRLYGIVKDDKSHVIGLLLYYLKVDDTLYGKVIDSESLGSSVKDKWKRQITTSVEALHGAGIIWGDAKASNILVDTDRDAWVTDFGGGYTEGWVDRDKAGTIEGDLQGLRAVIDFIDTGREPGVMI